MSLEALRRLICCAIVLAPPVSLAETSQAGSWPPADANAGKAAVAVTTSWTMRLRDARDLADVQKLAGAGGKRTGVETWGQAERAIFNWTGEGGKGSLRLLVYRSGGFAAIVHPADAKAEIILNSFGAFACPDCAPPVNACGLRPSWVPHDLHWDTYDCPRTIIGPQDMPGGK